MRPSLVCRTARGVSRLGRPETRREAGPRVIEAAASVTFEDRRFDYDEQRFVALGMLRAEVVVIATAGTDEEIRVISMRKAERHEEKIYHRNR